MIGETNGPKTVYLPRKTLMPCLPSERPHECRGRIS